MPKITKYQFKIAGKLTDIFFYYTTKKRFYAQGIPEEVEAVIDEPFYGYETEAKLYRFIQLALIKYHEYIKKSRKVIIYRLKMTTELYMVKQDDCSWQGYKPWVPKCFERGCGMDGFNNGKGFTLDWKILMEKKAEKTLYYEFNNDGSLRGSTYLETGYQVIQWTAEREAAFIQIENAMETMVGKLATVLGDQPNLLETIDNGIKLLN